MFLQLTFLVLSLCFAGDSPTVAATLATDGKPQATIVTAKDATLAEQTAAAELSGYLGKVCGGVFSSAPENAAPKEGARIFLGATQFAREHGLDAAALGPEEWVARTVDNDLILTGGRPRGTLYAVYHFLEDALGIHWWNPWEETVPRQPTLEVRGLNLKGKPVLHYRDIYMLYGGDGGRFAARSRLDRQGDEGIKPEFGGGMDYGPPYHVHTMYLYFPPEKYFAEHPEWFSLVGGKRSGNHTQLCLTNPQLRAAFLAKLKQFIQASREAAQKAGAPPPLVYDVSQNDWGGMCECEKCQALVKAEGSDAGPLLDFVNFLADSIKGEYPDVYIDTLAYFQTQQVPKTIKPRDNVIIRLCDTGSNFIKPITDPENKQFHDILSNWAKITKNLRIWDYAVTYAPYSGFPIPTVQTYAPDFQFYAEHNVEGVFTELEYPMVGDMRDFKVWMMMKLLEDPYRDFKELVATFTDGFYGAAGPSVREYLAKLEAAAAAQPSYLSMGGSPRAARYLDLAFFREATALFDRAEQSVAADPVLLRRVREARMPVDRSGVVLFSGLLRQWMADGNPPETMPLDREKLAKRYEATWQGEAAMRLSAPAAAGETKAAADEVAALTARKAYIPLPEKFRGLPAGTVFDFTADLARNWNDIVRVVPDAEAESGITDRLQFPVTVNTENPVASYKLPMPWGLYDVANKRGGGGATLKPEDVEGPGYHWYKMGTFPIGQSYYMYFFWSWIIQFDIDNVVDPKHPEQKFDVWARLKFEGPSFPHGKADAKDAICVERVVLVKSETK